MDQSEVIITNGLNPPCLYSYIHNKVFTLNFSLNFRDSTDDRLPLKGHRHFIPPSLPEILNEAKYSTRLCESYAFFLLSVRNNFLSVDYAYIGFPP